MTAAPGTFAFAFASVVVVLEGRPCASKNGCGPPKRPIGTRWLTRYRAVVFRPLWSSDLWKFAEKRWRNKPLNVGRGRVR
jgi:hypothetical protein